MLEDINGLITKHEIHDWDLILVGDGSGNCWAGPVGYACFLYEKNNETPIKKFVGGANVGTINFAELMPYIAALRWYNECKRKTDNPINVYILTDSKISADCGNRIAKRNKNGDMWASLDWFEDQGYCIQWIHINRNACEAHTIADQLASGGREFCRELDKSTE